jgi:hypothetical protein
MLPEKGKCQYKFCKHAAFLFKQYGCIIICTAAGTFAGFWAGAAGLAAGIFLCLIQKRFSDEKFWKKALEQGTTAIVHGEPFPGALYICALTVCSLGDYREAARLLKNTFGAEYHADWNSLCRGAFSAPPLNSDLLIECLANIIGKNEAVFTPAVIKKIFILLNTAEFSWEQKQEAEKPSRYLAELLDYRYVNDELSAAYCVLGLASDASMEQVKTAHRKLVARFHPDRTDGMTADADVFLRVQSAYEVILHQQS